MNCFNNFTVIPTTVRKQLFLCLLLLGPVFIKAQPILSSTLNISGSYATKDNLNLEWSVGESVLVNTVSNSTYIITQGLLQGFAAIKPTIGDVYFFQANEVKIYPNPVSTHFNLDIMSPLKGMMEWALYDNNGSKLKFGQFNYDGEGKSVLVDMVGLPAGTYHLRLLIKNRGNGFTLPMRQSGYKIIKVNQ